MKDLIEKLEQAEVGSRELDALIWLRFNRPEYTGGVKALEMRGWYDGRGHMILETDTGEEVADDLGIGTYTTSLDVAMAWASQVLPGWRFAFATMTPPWAQGYPPGSVEACLDPTAASTLPLALCLSVLQARAQSEARV